MTPEVEAALALVGAGVDRAAVPRALKMMDLAADATGPEIAAEVDALRAEVPGLFSNGVVVPFNARRQADPSGTARERAQRRFDATERALAPPPDGAA